jgi:pimeloyl-ACP methyl ester carboxylesterase
MGDRPAPHDDEFAVLAEIAEELGESGQPPLSVRRLTATTADGDVSAISWGDQPPELVLLHGGGQNAHTWDTVLAILGAPALAIDLPGHGHSSWRTDRDYSPQRSATTLAPLVEVWAQDARAVVGMSLGGLTTIALLGEAPELVRRGVIVDVTPSVSQRLEAMSSQQRGTTNLAAAADRRFADFDEMVYLIAAMSPQRSRASVRRGVLANSRPVDGGFEWRYDDLSGLRDFAPLWEQVAAARVPLDLIRGSASSFVSDDDAAEFGARAADARIHDVEGAGHSVQSDRPVELAAILREILDRA